MIPPPADATNTGMSGAIVSATTAFLRSMRAIDLGPGIDVTIRLSYGSSGPPTMGWAMEVSYP
jgi:hypothetical protein